jgi:ketosteroid isomerase-like protein
MNAAAEETIRRFYASFGARDGEAMAACYTEDARFGDPVFPELRGREPGDMWRMLTSTAADLRIELLEHEADGDRGSARWQAHYTFSRTGRPVVNDGRAAFRFAGDGRIAEHDDRFGFHAWARQALGTPGLLLGWTPLLQAQVRRQAAAGLAAFQRPPAAAVPAGPPA